MCTDKKNDNFRESLRFNKSEESCRLFCDYHLRGIKPCDRLLEELYQARLMLEEANLDKVIDILLIDLQRLAEEIHARGVNAVMGNLTKDRDLKIFQNMICAFGEYERELLKKENKL